MNWEPPGPCPIPCLVWHDGERESLLTVFQRAVLSEDIKVLPSFLLPWFRICMGECIFRTVFRPVWFTHYSLHLIFNFFILRTYDSMFYSMLKMTYIFSVEDKVSKIPFLEWYSGFPSCTNVVYSFPISRKLTAKFLELDYTAVGLLHYLYVCIDSDLNITEWSQWWAGSLWLSSTGRARLTFIHGHTLWKHTEPPWFTISLCLQ